MTIFRRFAAIFTVAVPIVGLVLALAVPASAGPVSKAYDARVVMVYDHECTVWCGKVKPILSDLKNEYKKVEFVELDTSKDNMTESKNTAKTMGISKFLNENAEYAPVIGVFSAKGKLVKELVGPKNKAVYLEAISQALSNK